MGPKAHFLHQVKITLFKALPQEKAEIEKKFSRIVTAFETLKNEREDYDHFLANPEDAYYKYWQYYR